MSFLCRLVIIITILLLRKRSSNWSSSRGPFYLRLAKLNPFHKAAVIKDPSGCLLTEYLARNYGVHPVVLVRHPIAFAASAKRLNWNPDGQLSLRGIREQREVVEQYFRGEEDFIYSQRKHVFEAAAVFWRTLNKIILIQCERNPDWHIITHEALCQEPIEYFDAIHLV